MWGGCDPRGYPAEVATRTPTRPRPSTRSSGSSASRRSTSSARPRTASRRPPARRPRRTGPTWPVRLLRALGRLIAGLWMLLAHGVGAVVRHLGGGARDLDPAQRRDGRGLAAIGGALVGAVRAWANAGGPLGHAVTVTLRELIGAGAMFVPIVLAVSGWRTLRRPPAEEPPGRAVLGWIAVGAGVLGILDLLAGDPTSQTGRRAAGGIFGVLAGSPIASALTAYLAVPILALVLTFGVVILS